MRRLLGSLANPPSVTVVEGAAGIGKSRLIVDALAESADTGRRVILGYCHPLAEPLPLGPVVDALRRAAHVPDRARLSPLSGALRHLLPELADRLPSWSDHTDPSSDRYLVFRAVRELLGALGPAVVVLEDMQWCDSGTVDFLRFLTAELPDNLVLVLTYRGEDVDASSPLRTLTTRCPPNVGTSRVVLSALAADHVHELTVQLTGDNEVSTEFTAHLHERTAGSPFAVEEMVRLVDDQRDPARNWSRVHAWEIDAAGVPQTIRDAVRGRVSRLPPDARRLAEAASVVRTPADVAEMASVAGLSRSRVLTAVRSAADAAVLVETSDGRYCHRHALANQAVYDTIPRGERALLHRRAAAALERVAPRPVARLANHYRQAGAPEQWASTAEAAADVAISAWDYRGAAHLLADVESLPHFTARDRSRVALKLARAALLGEVARPEAVSTLRRIIDTDVLPVPLRGELRHVLGDLLTSLGDTSGGRCELAKSLRELRPHTDLRAHALATLAHPCSTVGNLGEHMRYLDEAMQELPHTTDPFTSICILAMRSQILLGTGDRKAWTAVRDIPWKDTSPRAREALMWASANLVNHCFLIGDYERAQDFLADTVARAQDLDYVLPPGFVEGVAIALDWARGSWEGVGARAQCFAVRNADNPLVSTRSRRIAGLLALAAGRLEEAEDNLRAAFAEAERGGGAPAVATAAAGLARVRLAFGDARGARDEAARGLDVVRRKDIWVWAAEVAPPAVEAMLACGDLSAAAELTGTFAAGLEGRHAPLARAALALCRGMLGQAAGKPERAARELERAERAYARLPRPYDAAQAATRLGAMLLWAGDPCGGLSLSRALERFTAMEASADAAHVRRVLRRFSIEAPQARRGGRIGYGARLTPRQHEVAELAAQGHTNPEIGARLGLSPRTVANHLALAMNKLGVRSRTVLARRWDGNGGTGPAR